MGLNIDNHAKATMKTLLVLRHGKSSWDQPGIADHDRPLKNRGERDAPRIGRLIRGERLVPDLIVTSTALRARRTAEVVAAHCDYRSSIVENADLYPGSSRDYTAALKEVDDAHERIMIVAHNPGLEELVQDLTGRSERLPTAALVWISLPVTRWSDIQRDTSATLERLWRPKELDEPTPG